jgi:hypothetical protein
VLATETSTTVALYGAAAGQPLAVGRVVAADQDAGPLRRNDAALRALWADPRLMRLHPLLPRPLVVAAPGGWVCTVEQALPGSPARAAVGDPATAGQVLELAAAVAGTLHRATAGSSLVDDELFDRWVGGPLAAVRRARPGADGAEALESSLRSELLGRTVPTAWVHGDLWLGNLLLDSRAERIVGIVDWDSAVAEGLPLVDLLHLVVTTRAAVERAHFGTAVGEVLDGRPWTGDELRLLGGDGRTSSDRAVPLEAGVLLMWLGHVGAVLGKRQTLPSDRRWLQHNVDAVLGRL